jgi:hypothetical protein
VRGSCPPGHLVHGALRPVLDWEVRIRHAQQGLRQPDEAGLHPAGHVEDLVGRAGLGGKDVGAGDVADVDEVHRLRAVAEYEQRAALGDPLHPAHEHLGVDAVDVHPRAVDVEVAEGHVVEAVHRMEAAQEAFVEGLRRAVERVVCVRVVRLGGGEALGQAVDRGRRCGNHLVHAGLDGGLDDVEGAVDEHLDGQPGVLRALRDADCRLVEDHVDVLGHVPNQRSIADVALHDGHWAAGGGKVEVLATAAVEVVEDHDLGGLELDQLVGEVRADYSRASRDQDAFSAQRAFAGVGSRRGYL